MLNRRRFGALIASAVAGAAAPALARDDGLEATHHGKKQLMFDVAENMFRFLFDESPVDENKLPAYGNPFITEGYIYPYGTLNGGSGNVKGNGVLPNGDPEFPSLVIGRWTCRGWFVGNGAKTTTGPIVITHQLYDLGRTPGGATLCTDGYELADINLTIKRAITGGTGPYLAARGEANQILLGLNKTDGVNLRFVFDLKR